MYFGSGLMASYLSEVIVKLLLSVLTKSGVIVPVLPVKSKVFILSSLDFGVAKKVLNCSIPLSVSFSDSSRDFQAGCVVSPRDFRIIFIYYQFFNRAG